MKLALTRDIAVSGTTTHPGQRAREIVDENT
jgi:hypothetical protein